MREILYRGQRVDNREWVEGYLWCTHSNSRISAHISTLDGDIVDIYTDRIGQYTGLKDKNGVKIFEGDIVNCFEAGCFGYIYWNESEVGFYFKVLLDDGTFEEENIYDYLEYMMVMGNIYENPELLGVE